MTNTDFLSPRRSPIAFVWGALVLTLAACEDGGSGPVTATSQQSSETNSSQSTAPQSSTGTASSGTGATIINITKCSQPIGNKIFFKVGAAQLGIPSSVIVEAIPSSLRPPIKKEDATRELERQAAAGAGCPDRPLEAVLLVVNERFGHPLLEGTAGLVRAAPGATAQFAQLTQQLQQKPTQNCKPLSGELLACVGTETRGSRETPVMYVITTNASEKLNTGGPLAARCTLQETKIQGCNLIDTLPGGLTVDVTLNAGTYTTADLAGARAAALRQIGTYTN